MKATIYSTEGKKVSEMELPVQFNESYHPDLIRRAVQSVLANKRQPYGASPTAGKRHSVEISKRRRDYKGSYGHGISRIPRKTMWRRGTQFGWEGAQSPGTKGGRRAHPPKSEKDFSLKINISERKKAIRSALSATMDKSLVESRGHKLGMHYPILLESKAEALSKTKDVYNMLTHLGLKEELSRVKERKVRAGIGKIRGRKYVKKRGMLLVVSSRCSMMKSASNIPGLEISEVRNLNAEMLAPGTNAGRLTIYTDKAINEMKSKNLFMNSGNKPKEKKAKEKKEVKSVSDKKEAKKKPKIKVRKVIKK